MNLRVSLGGMSWLAPDEGKKHWRAWKKVVFWLERFRVAVQNLCHIHSLSWFAEPALLCHAFLVPKLAPSMWNSFLHLSFENTCWFFKTWVKCHTLWEAFPSSVLWALITFLFKHNPTQRLTVLWLVSFLVCELFEFVLRPLGGPVVESV